MTSEERIDAALDLVLKASGSALRYYTMQQSLDRMRAAMKSVMEEIYLDARKEVDSRLREIEGESR